MYSSTYIPGMCFVTPEFSVARVVFQSLKCCWQHDAIYPCDSRDRINQGHVFFFAFHIELIPFSDGQLSSPYPPSPSFSSTHRVGLFSTGTYIKVVSQYRPTNESLESATLPTALGSKKLYYTRFLKKTIK